jgi:hypothetical protein
VKICGRNALFSQWCRGGNWVCDKDVLELPVEFYNLKNATIYMKSKFQKILQRKEKEKIQNGKESNSETYTLRMLIPWVPI